MSLNISVYVKINWSIIFLGLLYSNVECATAL